MKGDAVNLARVTLVRLALAALVVALASSFTYLSGSLGTLSDAALVVAAGFMGYAGLAALAFGSFAAIAAAAAPLLGGRFFPWSLAAAVLSAALGAALAFASAAVGAFAAGLSV